MAGQVPLLDYVTPIFIGLKSTHTVRFFTQTNYRKETSDFYRTESERTRTDFHSAKIVFCALGIRSFIEIDNVLFVYIFIYENLECDYHKLVIHKPFITFVHDLKSPFNND